MVIKLWSIENYNNTIEKKKVDYDDNNNNTIEKTGDYYDDNMIYREL